MSLLQTSLTIGAPITKVEVEATHQAEHHAKKRAVFSKQRKGRRQSKNKDQHKAHTSLAHVSLLTSAHGSREEAQSHAIFFLFVAMLVMLLVGLYTYLRQDGPPAREEVDENAADMEVRRPGGFDEDVYMMAIALGTRDWHSATKATGSKTLPLVRGGYVVTLLLVCISIQMFLLYCTKVYVTPQAVASIRESYDAYELHMYGGEAHTRVLYTGKHRGFPQYFQPELFETLDDDVKGEVCQIPFSQLKFLVLVLLIWTMTCVCQINRCVTYAYTLLYCLPTISSMADSIVHEPKGKPRRKHTIVGLTMAAKLSFLFVIFVPWFFSTCFLCWLGCRWLAATNSFGDFVANAMALEFILQFKSLLYFAVTSERTKRDVQTTRHMPPTKFEGASFMAYFNTLLWGMLSISWVYMYIFHLQHVLPDYMWDVHEPCTPFLADKLAKPDLSGQ